MEIASTSLTTHRSTKQANWMKVNRWTRRTVTWNKFQTSGQWCQFQRYQFKPMAYFAQVDVVGLVLGRHEDNQNSIVELHIGQRWRSHEEENSEQDRHGDVGQNGSHEHGTADHHGNEDQCHTLFPLIIEMLTGQWNVKQLQLACTHMTPRNWGFSPGAAVSVSNLRALTWLMDKTVAATNQGKPKKDFRMIRMASTKRSRW